MLFHPGPRQGGVLMVPATGGSAPQGGAVLATTGGCWSLVIPLCCHKFWLRGKKRG